MIVLGTFPHSFELERALLQLEQAGIPRRQLRIALMDRAPEAGSGKPPAESLYSKSIELGIAVATGLSVIGASLGFILPLGPILMGLLSALLGFLLGFGIHESLRKHPRLPRPGKLPDVVVFVECREDQQRTVQELLWSNRAMTVGRLSAGNGG